MDFSSFDRKVIPAIPTLFSRNPDLKIDIDENVSYLEKLLDEPIGGIAALVHTGRGNFLTIEEKETYLELSTKICHERNKIVIAGVSTIEDTKRAKKFGVDAVLVFPNRADLNGLNDPERYNKIINYHKKIGEIHKNCIIFLLYEETGIGINYNENELKGLFSINEIKGIKLALLYNFEKLEDTIANICKNEKNTIIFTGEDRMYAESIEKIRDFSLITGKEFRINSLIGLGSALPWLQGFMLKNFDNIKHQKDYFKVRAIISELARATFVHPMKSNNFPDYSLPMEPYIMNMGYASKIQYNINDNAIMDIATIIEEQKKRNVPEIVKEAVSKYNYQERMTIIKSIMKKGLIIENELKHKYGLNFENLD